MTFGTMTLALASCLLASSPLSPWVAMRQGEEDWLLCFRRLEGWRSERGGAREETEHPPALGMKRG